MKAIKWVENNMSSSFATNKITDSPLSWSRLKEISGKLFGDQYYNGGSSKKCLQPVFTCLCFFLRLIRLAHNDGTLFCFAAFFKLAQGTCQMLHFV